MSVELTKGTFSEDVQFRSRYEVPISRHLGLLAVTFSLSYDRAPPIAGLWGDNNPYHSERVYRRHRRRKRDSS